MDGWLPSLFAVGSRGSTMNLGLCFFIYFEHTQVVTLMFGSARGILERGLVGTQTQPQL